MAWLDLPKGFIGAGDYLLDLHTAAGARTGMQIMGNMDEFTSAVSIDTEVIKSKCRGDHGLPKYGSPLFTLEKDQTFELSATLNAFGRSVMAAYHLSHLASVAQNEGAVAAVDVVVNALDRWLDIPGYTFLKSVTASDAGSPLVEGTDFRLSLDLGKILFPSTGAVTTGKTIEVTPTLAALESASQFSFMDRDSIYGTLSVSGYNRADRGQIYVGELPLVKLVPDGEFNWQSDDAANIRFKILPEYDSSIDPVTNQPRGFGFIRFGNAPA